MVCMYPFYSYFMYAAMSLRGSRSSFSHTLALTVALTRAWKAVTGGFNDFASVIEAVQTRMNANTIVPDAADLPETSIFLTF